MWISRFLANPIVPSPRPWTPAARSPEAMGASAVAPARATTRVPPTGHLSSLNPAASGLAVYASPRRLHGQDARLASGRWLGVTGRDWLPSGSERTVSENAS